MLTALFTVVRRKGKEIGVDKVQAEKIQAEKVNGREILPEFKLSGAVVPNNATTASTANKGVAFIRADERPPVGEAILSGSVRQEQKVEKTGNPLSVTLPLTLTVPPVEQTIEPKRSEKSLAAEKGLMAEIPESRLVQ
jgi:hypothetical protein